MAIRPTPTETKRRRGHPMLWLFMGLFIFALFAGFALARLDRPAKLPPVLEWVDERRQLRWTERGASREHCKVAGADKNDSGHSARGKRFFHEPPGLAAAGSRDTGLTGRL